MPQQGLGYCQQFHGEQCPKVLWHGSQWYLYYNARSFLLGDQSLNDVAEVGDSSDHLVVLWANLPTCGIISAAKLDFVISFLTNQLEKHKRNGVALIIHPNRAAQAHAAKTRVLPDCLVSI